MPSSNTGSGAPALGRSPYEILGVPPDANEDGIRAAFRRRALEVHPDREGGSTSAMTAVNAAYDVLRDPHRRKRFDDAFKVVAPRLPERVVFEGTSNANLGDRDTYRDKPASAVDSTRIASPTLTLDGWVLPSQQEY